MANSRNAGCSSRRRRRSRRGAVELAALALVVGTGVCHSASASHGGGSAAPAKLGNCHPANRATPSSSTPAFQVAGNPWLVPPSSSGKATSSSSSSSSSSPISSRKRGASHVCDLPESWSGAWARRPSFLQRGRYPSSTSMSTSVGPDAGGRSDGSMSSSSSSSPAAASAASSISGRSSGSRLTELGAAVGGDSGSSSSDTASGGKNGGGLGKGIGASAPWLARGLKALVRGGRGGETGTQLPSLGAVMDAVDARGAQDEVVAAEGRSKMQGVMSAELPHHPMMREGVLPNGLQYIILNNQSPPDRFEAHLEVFAGSANELESQQGMAHLVEHVAYMGSRKRERLFGTGSSTNAYTDFHHTVFYASCPVQTPPRWGRPTPMLGRALGALLDVLEAVCEESRLEKERSAVLSELTMVNTIDYRMECQVLSALHAENQLSRRFPIGKEELIKGWNTKDVLEFHRTHYRPDNAVLYCIGDLNVDETEEQIRQMFGHLGGVPDTTEPMNLKRQSLRFPPVTHQWSGGHVTERNTLPVMEPVDGKPLGSPRFYKHDLLQSFALHVFAKRPIEPITALGDFRRAIMKRIALAALQIRLSVNSRNDPPYLSVEFNQLDSPREGCAVCFLDMTAEPAKWKEALKFGVREVRRLGMFGLTSGELNRFSSALLTDARQLAAQGNKISNGEQVGFLMDTVASGHTFMDTEQTYHATRLAIESLTLEELNEVAAELCEHITLFGVPQANKPSAVVACVPTAMKVPAVEGGAEESTEAMELSEDDVLAAFFEAVNEEIKESDTDVEVPQSFFTSSELERLVEETKPEWVPASEYFAPEDGTPGKIDGGGLFVEEPETGTRLRRLSNGIRVNVVKQEHESQRGQVRLTLPGGRLLESVLGAGAVAIGARTMQEGGAFGNYIREQVELFCIDHLVMVTVEANDEFLYVDLAFPTTKLHGRGTGEDATDDIEGGLNGMEAAFQVLHQILSGFVWEEEALKRAKQSFLQSHETLVKSLEGRSTEMLMERMSGGDIRFMSIPQEHVEPVTLEQASKAINGHLTTDMMEVSLVGDFDIEEAERMTLQYLGTLEPSERDPLLRPTVEAIPAADSTVTSPRHLDVHLPDSDDRAVGYVAGSSPNRWGLLRDGSSVLDLFPKPTGGDRQKDHRAHPLFAPVALMMLKEALNRRLFSVVREQKRLTYDASIHLTNFDRLLGSWYLITVTAIPDKVDEAIKACQDTLRDMSGPVPITADNIESAKRVLINRHEGDLRTNSYWCDLLSGLQVDCLTDKDMSCITDFPAVVDAVTAQDLQVVLKGLTTDRAQMFTCAGVSGKKPLPRAATKSGMTSQYS
ncbi:unnamed protein product [Pylaiella littoralis]